MSDVFPFLLQSAEKALKAAVMNVDANRLHNRKFTTHDLVTLACETGNSELISLAQKFRTLVQEHTRMRYPENFTGGQLPSELYKETHAQQALGLAKEILDIVDNCM